MYFYKLYNLKMSDVNVSAVYDKVTITYNIQSLPQILNSILLFNFTLYRHQTKLSK